LKRITKAALGGVASCALILGGTQVAGGAVSEIFKFREALTDFTPEPGQPFDSVRAKTTISKTADGGTSWEVRMTGIDVLSEWDGGTVVGRTFGGHLHTGPCDPATNSGHYRHDTTLEPPALGTPPNELWFNFTPDADGMAYDVQTAPWVPVDEGQMSIVVHLLTADQPTTKSPKQACFPLSVTDIVATE
jgi:superoxide dismutase, Cu-Zn family